MVKYHATFQRYLLRASIILISALALIACKKKENGLGKDVLDPNSLLNSSQVDTFELQTFTYVEDSIITDNPAYAVLGSYNDPNFGTVNASFYTQFRLSGVNPNFGNLANITIDSIVLGLEYRGFYGEFSAQNLEVYEISESFYRDSTYYAFDHLNTYSTNLVAPGSETFVPNPSGITVIGEDTVDTQLRIHLKKSLAQRFLYEAVTGGSNFASNDNFLKYFKGLKVRVNNPPQASGKGGVFYFDLNDPLSKMTIYYTVGDDNKTFDLLINSECADFNHVDIDNSGKPVQNVINDTLSGQKEFYAQSFKSRAVVNIPSLKDLPKNAIIHSAQLILPVQHQTGAKYYPGDDLSVSVRVDGNLGGIGVLGLYDVFKKQYTADIRNYVQALIAGDISTTELILSPRFFINSADRIIFNGPETINKMRPRVVLTYTEF
ncbi:MAG: DUF4270 family protein [Flavobacteriia bacterium]|jgi:hypothetical protein